MEVEMKRETLTTSTSEYKRQPPSCPVRATAVYPAAARVEAP